jgi:hypothetical protein
MKKSTLLASGTLAIAALAYFSTPAVASDEGCSGFTGVCKTLYFTICIPAGPHGPEECTVNQLEIYGKLDDE